MKKGKLIKLSDGQKATLLAGDESVVFKNCYVVQLEDGATGVVDRKTLTLAKHQPDSRNRKAYKKK